MEQSAPESSTGKNRVIRFVAAACDFYILMCIGGIGSALASAIAGGILPTSVSASLLIIFPIAGTAAYHFVLSGKSDLRSPGDMIIGRSSQGGAAQYYNPYGINRWALFTVIIFTLMITSNAWDRTYDGPPWTVAEAIGVGMRCGAIVLGAVMMARGKLWGCIFAIAIYSLGAKSVYGTGIGNEIYASVFYLYVGLALSNFLVAVYYGLFGTNHDDPDRPASADA